MPEYRASPVPMPGNPAANRVGDKTGPFRILIESREPGGPWQVIEYRGENLPYDEAFAEAGRIHQNLNKN